MVFPNKTGTFAVAAASTALTSSYVAGTLVSAGPQGEHNAICIDVLYVKGDETSIQVKVEAADQQTDAASPVYYQQVTQSALGGTVTLVPAEYSMTAASAAATQRFALIITPVKGTIYKISVKATGGTPTGTYGVNAFLAWV